MKAFKSLIAVIALLGAVVSAKADAVFQFDTGNDNTAFGLVNSSAGTPANNQFYGQIYGSFTSSNPANFVALGTAQLFGTGGPGYIFQNSAVNVVGASAGATLNYVLKAWSVASGSTFETASASGSGKIGVSSQSSLVLADSFNPGQYQSSNGFNTFTLAAVPEPTTIALGVMGGMALLARRRRNAA